MFLNTVSQVDPASFRMLLSYIYEGRTQLPYDNLQTIMLLARQCGLPLLTEQLEKKLKEKMSFGGCQLTNIVIRTIKNAKCITV